MLLHWVEVSFLALSRHPLEAIPEEVTLPIFSLFDLGLVGVLLLEIRVRRHIVDYSSLVPWTSASLVSTITTSAVLFAVTVGASILFTTVSFVARVCRAYTA